ncbi:MAG: metallophosphoesterase [Bacteroidota bacterium]|nr:metallophosphoesterase [Bacteroidota bacterium]
MKKDFLILVFLFFAVSSQGFQELNERKFLNFSDIHFDPYYDTTLVKELIIADYKEWENIFLKSDIKYFSRYGSDSNFPLLLSTLEEMKRVIPRPDFIIITGDFLAHNFNENYEEYSGSDNKDSLNYFIEKTMKFITRMLTKYFPVTTIFPSVGNDDSYCGNYMIEPNAPFLKMLSEIWEPLVNRNGLNESFRSTFSKGGYCILNFPEGENYKMLILNTVFFSTNYKNLCGDTLQDPGAEELRWLRETLKQCKNSNQKVWLSYHIPTGIDIYGTIHGKGNCEEKIFTTWKKKYNEEFLKIINEYWMIINAGFAGHFHRDDFRIFYDEGIPISYIHITPSISPVYGNNPAYHIIQYNPANFELQNYRTYFLKNLAGNDSAYWTSEYDFQKTYKQDFVSAASLSTVSNLIFTDSSYRAEYINYYTAGDKITYESDYSTWFYNWCGFGYLTKDDYVKCLCADSIRFKK